MIKAIEKKCIISEDCITLSFSDTRDNYVYPNALGDIGEINIYQNCIFIVPNVTDTLIDAERKEHMLYKNFQEIFGINEKEIDYLSNEYYQSIKIMIATGALKSLGYKISTPREEEEPDEDYSYYNNKQHRRH